MTQETVTPLDDTALLGFAEAIGYKPPAGKVLTEKRLFAFVSKQAPKVIAKYPKDFLKVLADNEVIVIEKKPDAAPAPVDGPAPSPTPEPPSEKLAKAARETQPPAQQIVRKHPADETEMKASDSCYGKLFDKKEKVCKTCPVIEECQGATAKALKIQASKTEPEKLTKSALDQITREILELRGQVDKDNAKTYMAIGERMMRAKLGLPRGEYVNWVEERLGYRHETANDILRCYRAVHEIDDETLAQLGGVEAVYKYLGDLGLAKLSELADLGGEGMGAALLSGLPLPIQDADPSTYRKTRLERMSFKEVRRAVRHAKGRNPFKSSDGSRGRKAKFQDILKGAKWLEENATRVLAKKVVEHVALSSEDKKAFVRIYNLLHEDYLPTIRGVLKLEGVSFTAQGTIQK